MRKEQLKISLLLAGIVLLCLLIWRMEAMPSRVVLSSRSGVWDLRGVRLKDGHANGGVSEALEQYARYREELKAFLAEQTAATPRR